MEDLAEEPQMDCHARMVHAATTWTQQDKTRPRPCSGLEQVATGAVCTVIRATDTFVELGRPHAITARSLCTMLELSFKIP